jgi:hypothetical protein
MTLIDDRIKEVKALSAHFSSRLEAGGTASVDPKQYLLLVSQYIELYEHATATLKERDETIENLKSRLSKIEKWST